MTQENGTLIRASQDGAQRKIKKQLNHDARRLRASKQDSATGNQELQLIVELAGLT